MSSLNNVTPVFSIAPGSAPGQGQSAQAANYQLVVDQDELNVRTGHQYRRINSPYGQFRVQLARGGNAGLEPAFLEWITIELDEKAQTLRGDRFLGKRFLLNRVTVRRNNEKGTNAVSLTLEQETIGTPAETYYPPGLDLPEWPNPTLILPIIHWPVNPIFDPIVWDPILREMPYPELVGIGIAINDLNQVGRTYDFVLNECSWEDISGTYTGSIVSADYRQINDTLEVYILSVSGTTAYVYKCDDVLVETPSWNLMDSFSLTGTNPNVDAAAIGWSKTTDLGLVVWLAEDGTRYNRYDGSWSGATRIDSGAFTDSDDITEKWLDVRVDGTTQLVCGLSANDTYRLFRASGAGAFSQLTGMTENFDAPINSLNVNDGGDAYAASWSESSSSSPESYDTNDPGYDEFWDMPAEKEEVGRTGGSALGIDFLDKRVYNDGLGDDVPLEVDVTWNMIEDCWQPDRTELTSLDSGIRFDIYNTTHQFSYGPDRNINWYVYVTLADEYDGEGQPLVLEDDGTFTYDAGTRQTEVNGARWNHFAVITTIMDGLNPSLADRNVSSIRVTLETVDDIGYLHTDPLEEIRLILIGPDVNLNRITYDEHKFVHIDSYAGGSPAVTDILPLAPIEGYVPRRPLAVGADWLIQNRLSAMATSGIDTPGLPIRSSDYGTSWISHWGVSNDWIVIKQNYEVYVMCGEQSIDLSIDLFSTIYNRMGDWNEVIGTPGRFVNIIVLFVEV